MVFDLGNVLLPFDYKIILGKLEGVERSTGTGDSTLRFLRGLACACPLQKRVRLAVRYPERKRFSKLFP